MFKFQKGISTLIGLIIIIAAAALAIGGIFTYQKFWAPKENTQPTTNNNQQQTTQDETAGWKTYTNAQYGFGIKYPENWQIATDFPGRLAPGQTERRDGIDPKSFNFAPLTKDLTIEENGDIIIYVAPSQYNCTNYVNLGAENISGFLKNNTDKNEIEFCESSKYFRFSLRGSQKEVYQQVLSTFKFIESQDNIIYKNNQYGFEITLLDSWKGYSVISESWNGNGTEFQGPKIIIRNPKWTASQPWQDIPILVFTKEQWKLVAAGEFNVSAAPIGPSKLGENQNYVFALPPRWVGFIDALGQDEAVNITKTFKIITN